MKSSKKLAMLITALTLCSSAAFAAACEKPVPPGNEHTEHVYANWTVTTPPTCTEPGVEMGTCECGETDTRPVDALGHDYEWSVTTQPTCEGQGVETGVCKNDETHTTTKDIDPIGHDYEWSVTTDPTCTEAGVETGVCKNNETHTTTREVPATGHTMGNVLEVTKEASCTEEGEARVLCEVCGAEHTATLPRKDHEWGDWVVDGEGALCTEETSRTHTCEVCGETESRVVPASEHRYADWSVTKEATCTEAGSREHTCVVCGHTEQEVIGATGHHYTAWQITNPTETQTGLAKKVCSGDKELDHVITVNLPVLSDESYDIEVDEETGVATYTLSHESGDIVFKVYQISGVADAVDVAFKTQSQVIQATANRYNTMVTENGPQASSREIVYELGVNYAHVIDGSERKEYFYSLNEDGTLFPVMHSFIGDVETGDIQLVSKDVTATADSLNGYGYGFTFMTAGNVYYGTGSIINYLYAVGSNNSNKDFREGTKTDEDGNTVYYFGYGLLYGKYFDVVYAEFSLDNSYIVSNANLNVKTYVIKESAPDNGGLVSVNDPLLTLDEEGHYWYDGNLLISSAGQETSENPGSEVEHIYTFPEAVDGYVNASMYLDSDGTPRMRVQYTATFEQLPDGTYRVADGMEDLWANSETFIIKQKTQLDAGETLPTNPYKYEDFIISSFTLRYGDVNIEEGEEFVISAKEPIVLSIDNVLPSTYNPYFDKFDVYLIDDMGNEVAANSSVNVQDGEIGYYFYAGSNGVSITKDYSITIKSFVAGEWDLKIVTEKKTFTIHLIVNYIAPDPLYVEVYQVNDISGKATWNKSLTQTEVYENQALEFRAAVDHPYYESSLCDVTVTKDGENVTADCITVTAIDGLPVYTFRSAEVGVYTIDVVSRLNSDSSVTLTVTVKEAPDVSDLLVGNYSNDDLGYAVEFKPAEEGALNGTAVITKGFPEDGEDNLETTTITYSYDAETRMFTSEYVSGAEGDFVQGTALPYNYSFELSESYKLYLTYESGFDGSRVKILIGGVQNSLVCSGANITAKAIEYADKLTANVSGTYKITATSSTFVALNGVWLNIKAGNTDNGEPDYVITDEEADYVNIFPYISSSVTLDLYIGDYIQIWNGISSAPTYSIELIEEFKFIPIEGITFEQETAEVREGDTLVLAPVFTPENTTQRGLVWTTTDASIAAVDENGIVTGRGAGTATITAMTSNGRYSASIEITVVGANILNSGENSIAFTSPFWDSEYTFSGEEGKTYTVQAESNGAMGGKVVYNGIDYSFPAKFDIAGGEITLSISSYSYGSGNVIVTITEKVVSGEPEPDFDPVTVGETTVNVYPNYIYYTVVGEPGAKYTVTVGPDATLYAVVNGVADNSNYASKTMEYTADANGFANICFFPGQGPGDYTINVVKTGGGAVTPETNFPALNVGDTVAPASSGNTYYTLVGEPNTTYTLSAPDLTFYDVVDGKMTYDGFKTGTKEYTTDANGLVDICVYRGGNPAGDYTIVITKAGSTPVTPPAPSDLTEQEEADGIIFIGGSGDYGVDSGANYFSIKVVYKLVVAEGESYSLTSKNNAYIKAGKAYVTTNTGYNITSPISGKQGESYEINTAGTYYIGLMSNTQNTVYAWFTVTKTGGEEPEPITQTLTIGFKLVEVGANGVSLTFSGLEEDKTYQLIAYDDFDNVNTAVTFSMETKQGNPLTFTYSGTANRATMTSTAAGSIAVELKEYEEEAELEEVTVGQEVTVSGAGEFAAAVYKIDLAAGYYNIYVGGEKADEVNAGSDVAIAYLSDLDDYEVIESDNDGNVAVSTAGTYYVLAYVNDSTFKIEKNDELGVPEPPEPPEPGPEPTPGETLTVTVPTDSFTPNKLNVGTLDENGVTIVLEGCVEGSTYRIYWVNPNTFVEYETIDIIMDGQDTSYLVAFTYDGTTNSCVVKSNSGTLSNVVITVELW